MASSDIQNSSIVDKIFEIFKRILDFLSDFDQVCIHIHDLSRSINSDAFFASFAFPFDPCPAEPRYVLSFNKKMQKIKNKNLTAYFEWFARRFHLSSSEVYQTLLLKATADNRKAIEPVGFWTV